jgi:hypothetical protein
VHIETASRLLPASTRAPDDTLALPISAIAQP